MFHGNCYHFSLFVFSRFAWQQQVQCFDSCHFHVARFMFLFLWFKFSVCTLAVFTWHILSLHIKNDNCWPEHESLTFWQRRPNWSKSLHCLMNVCQCQKMTALAKVFFKDQMQNECCPFQSLFDNPFSKQASNWLGKGCSKPKEWARTCEKDCDNLQEKLNKQKNCSQNTSKGNEEGLNSPEGTKPSEKKQMENDEWEQNVPDKDAPTGKSANWSIAVQSLRNYTRFWNGELCSCRELRNQDCFYKILLFHSHF